MLIRPYDSADAEPLIALWREAFGYQEPHNDPRLSLERKLSVDSGLLLVAERDAQLVGAGMAGYDGHRGWIYSLAVAEAARGTGVGSALLRRLEELLIARGCVKINIQVRAENEAVAAFYERHGYTIEPRVSLGKIVYRG